MPGVVSFPSLSWFGPRSRRWRRGDATRPWSRRRRRGGACRGSFVTRLPAQVSSKEVLDYLGFRDSKFMHAAFQLLGEPWDGSRMDFGETVKCIAQFCMFGE